MSLFPAKPLFSQTFIDLLACGLSPSVSSRAWARRGGSHER
jgi:hypothetical protein